LSFADVAGFRCGVCYEFTTFNVKSSQPLKVKERNLVVMEVTVIDEMYMNLGIESETTGKVMKTYKKRCQLFNGDFTLLWHNNRFIDSRAILLYQEVIKV
jgi:hypothetical protein